MKKSAGASSAMNSPRKGKEKANKSKLSKQSNSFPASWISVPTPRPHDTERFRSDNGLTMENVANWSLAPGEHAVTRLRQTVLARFNFKSELFDPNGLVSISERVEEILDASPPSVRKVFKVTNKRVTEWTDLGQIIANHAAFLDGWNDSVHAKHSLLDYEGYGLIPSIPGRQWGRATARNMLPNIISSIVFIDHIYFAESTWPHRTEYFDQIFAASHQYSLDADQLSKNSSPIYYDSDDLVPNTTSAPWICRESVDWRDHVQTLLSKGTKQQAMRGEGLVGFSDYSNKYHILANFANEKSHQGACEASLQRAAWGFVTVYGLTEVSSLTNHSTATN